MKKAAMDYGPYPLKVEPLAASQDPATVLQQVSEANRGTERRISESLQASSGDSGKAVELLLAKANDPDAAEALMTALRDLAPQGSERTAQLRVEQQKKLAESQANYQIGLQEWQAKPVNQRGAKPTAPQAPAAPSYRFKAAEGQPGVLVVARTAEALRGRAGKPEAGRFDEMLLMECMQQMANHGASEVPEGQKVALADGSGKASPVNPSVRATLLGLLKDDGLQPFACNALGRLGDMATAKEIIEHPRRYPGANIGAFGPNAVEAYKQARLKQLKTHSGSEAEFWISSRLGYRDREAALDLALAGDGGAGTAVTRNVTLEAMYAKDRDGRMAQAVDTYMRFPATRAGIKAGIVLVNNPTCGLEAMLFQERCPKTRAMTLRYLEYLMRRTFVEARRFTDGDGGDDPVFSWGILIKMNHYKRYNQKDFNKYYASFYNAAEAIFRKYYPAGKACQRLGCGFQQNSIFFALHLGLKPHQYLPPYEMRMRKAVERGLNNPNWKDRLRYANESPKEQSLGSDEDSLCINLGHYRLEDLP